MTVYICCKRKRWKEQEIKLGPRPIIKDAKGNEAKTEEQETEFDSLDELEREILGDDNDDKELANIQQKRRQQLQKEWKKKQVQMAQVN